MKHRYAVLGAIAIGVMIAFLMVGRVRGVEPSEHHRTPGAEVTQPAGHIAT